MRDTDRKDLARVIAQAQFKPRSFVPGDAVTEDDVEAALPAADAVLAHLSASRAVPSEPGALRYVHCGCRQHDDHGRCDSEYPLAQPRGCNSDGCAGASSSTRAVPSDSCTTPGCPGDSRYPGLPWRGHIAVCPYPAVPSDHTATTERQVPHDGPGHPYGDAAYCGGCLAEREAQGATSPPGTVNGLDVHDWAKIARAKEEALEAALADHTATTEDAARVIYDASGTVLMDHIERGRLVARIVDALTAGGLLATAPGTATTEDAAQVIARTRHLFPSQIVEALAAAGLLATARPDTTTEDAARLMRDEWMRHGPKVTWGHMARALAAAGLLATARPDTIDRPRTEHTAITEDAARVIYQSVWTAVSYDADRSTWRRVSDAAAHALAAAGLLATARPDTTEAQATDTLVTLVRDLADPDDCSFDHDGGCQAHGYLTLMPGQACPHAEAKQWLAQQEARRAEGCAEPTVLATARPDTTEWGVRAPMTGTSAVRMGNEQEARRAVAASPVLTVVRREVTAWTEADQ